jgi:hypothetical protein
VVELVDEEDLKNTLGGWFLSSIILKAFGAVVKSVDTRDL